MTRSTSTRTTRVFEKFTSSIGALALTALMFVASNAYAAPRSQYITLHVANTVISTPQEAAKLYSGIKAAARQECGLNAGRLTLAKHRLAQRCYDETVEDAVSTINHPQLTAVHESASNHLG